MPEMTKSSIPEDDPIRSLMPNLQPLEKDQVGKCLEALLLPTSSCICVHDLFLF